MVDETFSGNGPQIGPYKKMIETLLDVSVVSVEGSKIVCCGDLHYVQAMIERLRSMEWVISIVTYMANQDVGKCLGECFS